MTTGGTPTRGTLYGTPINADWSARVHLIPPFQRAETASTVVDTALIIPELTSKLVRRAGPKSVGDDLRFGTDFKSAQHLPARLRHDGLHQGNVLAQLIQWCLD